VNFCAQFSFTFQFSVTFRFRVLNSVSVMFFCAKFRCFQSSEFAQFSHLVFNSAIVTNGFGYDTLRKNPQDSFRRSRKIVNCNEIPIGISAAMDYSHCCTQFFILVSSIHFLFSYSNTNYPIQFHK